MTNSSVSNKNCWCADSTPSSAWCCRSEGHQVCYSNCGNRNGLALDATKVVYSVPAHYFKKKKKGPWYKSLDRHEFGFHHSSQAAEKLTSCALLVVKSQSTGWRELMLWGSHTCHLVCLIVGTLHLALKGKGQLSAEPHLLFLLSFLLWENRRSTSLILIHTYTPGR